MRRAVVAAAFVSTAFAFCTPAHAELAWSPSPGAFSHAHADAADGAADEGRARQGGHSHHRQGGEGATLYVGDKEGVRVELWKPTLERLAVPVEEGGRIGLRPTGMDNYHVLVATREQEGLRELALRYVTGLGRRPSGHSPAELTAAVKGTLEIVPAPLPREHRRYVAEEDPATFIVRFNGRPLAGVLVQLQTSIGSLRDALTDEQGRVSFSLPDDFPVVEPGRRGNRPAEFVVRAEYQADDTTYWTTLSAAYHVNPSYWQSTKGGIAIAAFGFLTGLLLMRRARAEG